MARDNDKGLYLPLKIDLNQWEQSLAQLDAPLQQKMRELRQKAADINLKYKVDISGAKAAGNQLKVIQLQTERLTQLFRLQEATVNGLTEAYKKQAAQTGVNSKEAQALARQLQNETIKMNNLQAQMNAAGEGLGAKISNGLASLSPTFAALRSGVASISTEFATLSTSAGAAGVALGAVGVAAAGIYLGYKGLEKLTNGVNQLAEAGVKASDPIFQLRERLNSTYEDAEYLHRVTALDGSSADALASSLERLNRQLDNDKEGTGLAAKALERYNIQLRNADGTMKTYKEQLQELARGYQLAAKNNESLNFFEAFKGTDQFVHLLADLDGYNARAVAVYGNTRKMYQALHDYGEKLNAVAEAQRELDAIKGGFAANSAIENLNNEIDSLKATGIILDEHKKKYDELYKKIGLMTNSYTDLKSVMEIAWENIKVDIADAVLTLDDYLGKTGTLKVMWQSFKLSTPFGALMDNPVVDWIKGKIDEAKAAYQAQKEIVKEERETAKKKAEEEAKNKNLGNLNTTDSEQNKKKEQEAQKEAQKRADAEKKLAEELRSIQQTEYEREIQRIKDKRDAYINAGADRVAADRLYALEREKIDQKYYAKQKAENDRMVKEAQAAYKQITEEQKRQREANISEAERNLQTNLKIIRRLQMEEKAGGDYVGRTKEYADRLYKKQLGVKDSDIAALAKYGNALITDIGNARDRVLGMFGGGQAQQPANTTNNNTVNVSFDNTVVENEAALQTLANRVADLITPVVERAIGGTEGSNNYQQTVQA